MPLTARRLGEWSKDMAPALAVLLTTIIFSAAYDKSIPFSIWLALSQTLLRFLRFASLLCIPLLTLPKIYAFITRKKSAYSASDRAERGIEDQPDQALGFQALSGNRHRPAFWNEVAHDPSTHCRPGSGVISPPTGRPLSTGTSSHNHPDHCACFPPALHPLDARRHGDTIFQPKRSGT